MVTLSPKAAWSSAAGTTGDKGILEANHSSTHHAPGGSLESTLAFPSYPKPMRPPKIIRDWAYISGWMREGKWWQLTINVRGG